MALESLFLDRSIRKEMRDTIQESVETPNSHCDSCDRSGSVMEVYGIHLCEHCCNVLLEASQDYDRVFTESITESNINDILDEGYVLPDMKKLEADANAKFKGSIPDLMKSYDLNPHPQWDDRITQGKIYIRDNNITGGKSKVNKFLMDYDCSFLTDSAAKKLVPDKDGTLAPLKVKGKLISNSTNIAKTPQAPIKPQGVKNTTKVSIPGKSLIKIISKVSNQSDKVTVSFEIGSSKFKVQVDDGSDAQVLQNILKEIDSNPGNIFPSFEDEDMKNGYVLDKYPLYSFKFDNNSFTGQEVSMIMVMRDKSVGKRRIAISDKALSNRAKLNSDILSQVDYALKSVYPALFNNSINMKTSLGKAVTELISIDRSSASKLGEATLRTTIDRYDTEWSIVADVFKQDDTARSAVCDAILKQLAEKLIPGWNDSSIQLTKTSQYKGFILDKVGSISQKEVEIKAELSSDAFYDKGDFQFFITVKDKAGDVVSDIAVYRKAGVSIREFMTREGARIYQKEYKPSDMGGKLTLSARKKLESSKRESFLYKVASTFMEKVYKVTGIHVEDLSCEIEKFELNKHGAPIACNMRISDSEYSRSQSSEELKDYLSLDSKLNFLTVSKVDSSPSGMSEYGPSVVYRVSDIDGFSRFIELSVMESAMYEAYNITITTNSGMKQIFA